MVYTMQKVDSSTAYFVRGSDSKGDRFNLGGFRANLLRKHHTNSSLEQ